ncbi:hypothetical protein FKP32DRAFT_631659 [Trametes sanguinea]|nr:hypothetical protein FKP32DRAFT_631659 [Trametes sanguinea]
MMLIQCLGPREPPRDAVSIVTAPRLPLPLGLFLSLHCALYSISLYSARLSRPSPQELVPGRTAGSSLYVLSPPLDILLAADCLTSSTVATPVTFLYHGRYNGGVGR